MPPETQSTEAGTGLRDQLLSLAGFTPKTDENGRELSDAEQITQRVEVHFNPESLDITFTNTLQKGKSKQPAQTVTETTAKLSVELLFDTTMTGQDVRASTVKVAKLMDPTQKLVQNKGKKEKKKIPAIVAFQWGSVFFEGYIDSFKEKLELFSAEGIPLRASVTISMTQQQRNVDPLENDLIAEAIRNSGVGNNNLMLHNNDIPPNATVTPNPAQRSVTQQAQAQGDASAGRRIARLNGIENMRLPEVESLAFVDVLQRRATPILSTVARSSDNRASGPTAMRFARLRQAARPETVLTPRSRLRQQKLGRLDHDLSIGPGTTFGIGGDVQQNGSTNACSDVGLHSDLPLGIHFED